MHQSMRCFVFFLIICVTILKSIKNRQFHEKIYKKGQKQPGGTKTLLIRIFFHYLNKQTKIQTQIKFIDIAFQRKNTMLTIVPLM